MALNPLAYIKESKAELDKVEWPTRKETLRLTILVLVVSVIVGAYVSGLDAIFATLIEKFLIQK
ncbi:preprotein translocase subunit SecE [Candidatus Curtissbacteria bacterium RBG_13_35_7]|uniref:Protein translocase subunit SecE n=1 Tax=Candidatus Curtissbacteria bacterium RBG_13_35_7 TaxID=1797705 RepID=A0A1F5G340_9BACT|nr:MAG: preprotein translocase subunit SecE [Candidatus Curtissbacteria bacterium RBG_13_35_7]